ncbi:hypothetical protein MVEN_01972500 [Mycena venus]|uniref:C2 domain-containing protein n=1 Tax=Mycena venus TaxID=2733690 RepID=A0A8H6XD97_9AGAR|nr:hypothetical protein MVEN_01972500 [Mycena venus]
MAARARMGESNSQTAQIHLSGAKGIAPSRWRASGTARAYVTVRVSGTAVCIKSRASPPSVAPVWHETLPPFCVSPSSIIVIQIHRLSMFPGFSRVVAVETISISDLVQLQQSTVDEFIHLPITLTEGGRGKLLLTLSFQIQSLKPSAVQTQLASIAAHEIMPRHNTLPPAATSDTLSRIMSRLGAISRFSVKFAQLHPVSAAAVTLVGAMAESIELQLDSNASCATLMLDVHRVLAFTESTEVLPQISRSASLISEILACVVDCVRYVYNHRDRGTAPSFDRDREIQGAARSAKYIA